MIVIINKIKKAFIGGEWSIAYKNEEEFQVINLPKGLWAADPILFKHDNIHYLFAEIYETKKKKASIGYFVFENGKPIYKGLVIETNYHMSYPCVFEVGGTVYMVPESSSNRSVDLYKATHFPNEWKKEKSLLTDCDFVDSTVFETDGKYYLFTYARNKSNWSLVYYSMDVDSFVLKKEGEVFFKDNIGRPAGKFFKQGGNIIRPAQDSFRKYGESVIFYKVISVDPYAEEELARISTSDLGLVSGARRVHTFSKDDKYVVIDFFVEKFELFHAFEIYKRSHLGR